MMPPRLLLCQCRHARVLPQAGLDAVFQSANAAGLETTIVPDLCELAAGKDPLLKSLSQAPALRIAACHPRAVRWLFAAAAATLDLQTTEIIDLRAASPEAAAAVVAGPQPRPNAAHVGTGLETPALEADATPSPAPPPAWKAWFPVIDFERCTQCMQCLSFCLFGVYAVNEDRRIEVRQPESCKPNCPACSRVCPEGAILFPKHATAAINGAETARPDAASPRAKVDISALLGGNLYETLRGRNRQATERFSKDRDPETALDERRRCLAEAALLADIPPEVLMSLPSPEEIQRRAEAAQAQARAALRDP